MFECKRFEKVEFEGCVIEARGPLSDAVISALIDVMRAGEIAFKLGEMARAHMLGKPVELRTTEYLA